MSDFDIGSINPKNLLHKLDRYFMSTGRDISDPILSYQIDQITAATTALLNFFMLWAFLAWGIVEVFLSALTMDPTIA